MAHKRRQTRDGGFIIFSASVFVKNTNNFVNFLIELAFFVKV